MTQFLTQSPEPCLLSNNAATGDCFFQEFALIPPFTDLTYPQEAMDIVVNTSSSNTKLLIGIIVGVGGAVILLIVGIAIVWKVRRTSGHSDYEEISTK